ncbi:MAG: hypothetical protein HY815_23355 [Candidatus Riflebacteria bacterium]|nr:hypothetical protein [Candidatus Riflebacteria bacterium]
MPDPGRPSNTALITSACFAGSNLAVLAAGGFLGFVLFYFSWMLPFLCWGATGVVYAGRVLALSQSPTFIDQVAREDAKLLPGSAPSAKVLEHFGGGLTGKYLASFNRVKELKSGLAGEIRALPEGPGKDAFLEFVPSLDDITTEVHKIASQLQKLDKQLAGGAVTNLEREIADLEAKVAASTDPGARQQLEAALSRKREAVGHYRKAGETAPRLEAQIEALAAALQEARARVAATKSALQSGTSIDPARQKVEDISRDVKYLSETVEETVKLLK